MKFVANDGKIFDTMEECEEYERKVDMWPLGQYWDNNITMFNYDGKIVELDVNPNDIDYFKHLSTFLETNDVWYIIIPKKCDNDIEWEKICNLIDDEYSVAIPYSSGIWHWNEDEWRNFEDDYKTLMQQWEPIKQYLPNMDAH